MCPDIFLQVLVFTATFTRGASVLSFLCFTLLFFSPTMNDGTYPRYAL